MDPPRAEGGCQRDEKSAGAHFDHLEDAAGEQGDVPVSWVTGKNFRERVETRKRTLCGTEFSINRGAELEAKEINLPGIHMPTGVQENTLKHGGKGPEKEVEGEEDEETLVISSSEYDSSCSFGSSEEDIEVEEECEDMDDSDEDEDEGKLLQHLPMPVPTTAVAPSAVTPAGPKTAVAPNRSPLQMIFPHLRLPSAHPLHLLQPVDAFQPRSQLFEALTEMGISSRAATKALFWTGNCSLQAAAEWCFSNPGREMELLSLEEEVVMWMQDLKIKDEEQAEEFEQYMAKMEMEARRKAQMERMMEEAEIRRAIEMSRAMQIKVMAETSGKEELALVGSSGKEELTLVEISGKEELTLVGSNGKEEGEIILVQGEQHVVNTNPHGLWSQQCVMDISDDSEEEYLNRPRVVLFINSKARYVYNEVASNDLVIELYKEAENVAHCEEMLMLWEEAGLSYEIRLVEDEDALLEKREVVTTGIPEEDTIWVEKWVGGVGNYSVRTFVAFALMGRVVELMDIVDDTHLLCTSTVDSP